MCGIIGIVGDQDAPLSALRALRRLEYRGYDSAGIATIDPDGKMTHRKAVGKLTNLESLLRETPLSGATAIGHTRWATHGAATETNAHPHISGPIAVVHNGIIENFKSLRAQLQPDFEFQTETDTETIAHLIMSKLGGSERKPETIKDAFSSALKELKGAFALGVLVDGIDDLILGARRGSPLVIGVGEGVMFLGSDALAVSPFTNRVIYLQEDDWCAITKDSYEIFDAAGTPVERPVQIVQASGANAEKGNYRHFMLKEIFEQPESTARTNGAYVDRLAGKITLPNDALDALDIENVTSMNMVACGTAYYACAVAEYWFEQIARIPVSIDIASEFRYREPVLPEDGLALFVSQSGETADTLAALRYCQALGQKTAAVVNVETSTIAREADAVLPTLAGPEIGVASTKAFTAQLCALAATAIAIGAARGVIDADEEARLTKELVSIPRLISQTLLLDRQLEGLARSLVRASDVLYLGRGPHFPIALEGALKLKEISYIHAEGYAAGELKHGPIALVDPDTPIIFVAPYDRLFEKSFSNLEEVVARRGEVVLISDEKGLG